MKRRTSPTAAQIAAAMRMYEAAAPARTARSWLVHFPDQEPVIRRYQWPTTRDRVLADHRAAIAAEPMEFKQ